MGPLDALVLVGCRSLMLHGGAPASISLGTVPQKFVGVLSLRRSRVALYGKGKRTEEEGERREEREEKAKKEQTERRKKRR